MWCLVPPAPFPPPQGDEESAPSASGLSAGFGGMILISSPANIDPALRARAMLENVELRRMGQAFDLGRSVRIQGQRRPGGAGGEAGRGGPL